MGIVDDVGISAAWIAETLQSSGYQADFTPDSLREIERFFDEHSSDGAARPGGLLDNDLGGRPFAVGSYMGEVVGRDLGGTWKGDDQDPQAEINVALWIDEESVVWPVQRAMKCFRGGPIEGITGWGAGIGLDMSSQPPTRPPKKGRFGRKR